VLAFLDVCRNVFLHMAGEMATWEVVVKMVGSIDMVVVVNGSRIVIHDSCKVVGNEKA